MAKRRIASSRSAAPRVSLPWRPSLSVAWLNWQLLIAIVVLTLAFDFLEHLTAQGALFVAAPVLLYLGMNFLVRHDRPIYLTFFDVVSFCLWFYLLASLVIKAIIGDSSFDLILRNLRFAMMTALFYVVVSECRNSYASYAKLMHLIWVILIGTCLFAFLQTFGQLTGLFNLFLEYSRMRTFRSLWQVTAYFAEPALLGQFLVACLFVFFHELQAILRHWLAFAIVVIAIVLTQSVGTLAGLLIWTLFVIVYNVGHVLSVRQLYAKLLVIGLIVLGLLTFINFSRLLLVDLATLEQLDSSGEQRVARELLTFQHMLERHQIGVLFGLPDQEAETVRSAAGFSDKVSGNALVEIILRYGAVVPLLLALQFCAAAGVARGLVLFGVFALLGQIDGGVAKPFLWLYVALIAISLSSRRWQRLPTAAAPAAAYWKGGARS